MSQAEKPFNVFKFFYLYINEKSSLVFQFFFTLTYNLFVFRSSSEITWDDALVV